MRLYNDDGERLYLNAVEHERFLEVALTAAPMDRRLAYTLIYTGMRISEALSLKFGSLQLDTRVASVRTLKRRGDVSIREVPIALPLRDVLGEVRGPDEASLWMKDGRPLSRITAYRSIKQIMDVADIYGPKACPKGLRHAFAIHAIMSNMPLHMVQRWLGHASMETTAIYATVLGPDQLALADRMW